MMLGMKLLLSLVLLLVPGEAVLRWCAPGLRLGWRRPLVAFAVGQGVATLCLWLVGMAGVPMSSWGIAIVLVLCGVALWGAWWRVRGDGRDGLGGIGWPGRLKSLAADKIGFFMGFGGRRPPLQAEREKPCLRFQRCARVVVNLMPWVVVLLATWVVSHQAAEVALKYRIDSVPGMGNWAYKTQLLVMSGSWPADFFEFEAHNRRMGYPPGFPLLCVWCAAFMGGFETHAIRLLPVLLMAGTFLLASAEMVGRARWWGVAGVVALLALFLAAPGRSVLSAFYAEPLLCFTAVVAVVALGHGGRDSGATTLALVAAGCMAWTKNEGVVGFFLLAGCVFLFARQLGATRMRVVISASAVACVMILPWRAYLAAHGWSDESFAWQAFAGEGRWERLAGAWEEYRMAMLTNGARFGGAWWIAPLLAAAVMLHRNGIAATLCITAVGWVAVAILMMMGSTEDDFAWHVRAAPRVLLCPSLLLLLAFAHSTHRLKSS